MIYVSYPQISPPAQFQSQQTVHIARLQAHTQQKCQHTQALNKQALPVTTQNRVQLKNKQVSPLATMRTLNTEQERWTNLWQMTDTKVQ